MLFIQKIKTTVFVFIISLLSITTMLAQGGGGYTSLNILPGYGLDAAPQNLGDNVTLIPGRPASHQLMSGSFGRGFNFGANYCYMINEVFGTELGCYYLKSAILKSHETDMGNTYDNKVAANMFRIVPSFMITTDEEDDPKGKLRTYVKFGVAIGFASIIDALTITSDSSMITNVETKYSGGTSVGVALAFGFKLKLSDKISFFTEISGIGQSYSPAKSEVTKYTVNGIDKLSSLTANDRETNYVDSNLKPDVPGSPRQEAKQAYPFSSGGINVGIRFFLSK